MKMHLAIIRIASLLVSRKQRGEWLAQWRSELWYVLRTPRADATAFCLGAFNDALWLRRNTPRPAEREMLRWESPLQCCLFLAVVAAISLSIALLVPGARNAILPSPYRDARDLVVISPDGHFAAQSPTIAIEEYRSWTNSAPDSPQRPFTSLAFYQPIRMQLHMERREIAELSVARASGNLFELLNIPVPASAAEHTATLILSHAAWRKYFEGDPHIAGHVLEVAGQRVQVAGTISEDLWRLPGHVEAWLLEDQESLDALPSHSKGFVLAHIKTQTLHWPTNKRWRMSVPNEDGGYDGFGGESLAERIRAPLLACLFPMIVAFLVLPTTTSLSLGDYRPNRYSPPRATRLRRWIFLSTKIALILTIVYCGSLDLAYLAASIGSNVASLAGFTFPIALRCSLTFMAFASFFLPAAIYRSRDEYPASGMSRWIILSAKILFILPIVFCGFLKLMSLSITANPAPVQMFASLIGGALAFRWALRDQRQRCPVCLRLLTNPVRVGQASHNFLAWNGTELICARGHGLLHVPETPTSWFSTQRWLYLDPSWSSLFS